MNQKTARNRQSKKEQHPLARKQLPRKRKIREETKKGKEIIYHIGKTIKHFFPDLWDQIDTLSDTRKQKSEYSMAELIGSCIAMFIFKEGSRNAYNQSRMEGNFKKKLSKNIWT